MLEDESPTKFTFWDVSVIAAMRRQYPLTYLYRIYWTGPGILGQMSVADSLVSLKMVGIEGGSSLQSGWACGLTTPGTVGAFLLALSHPPEC